MAIEIFWRKKLFQMMYGNMTFVGDNRYRKHEIQQTENILWNPALEGAKDFLNLNTIYLLMA